MQRVEPGPAAEHVAGELGEGGVGALPRRQPLTPLAATRDAGDHETEPSEGEGGGIDRSAIATVLDHMVDQVETLQSLFAQSEARRADTEARLIQLTGAIEGLAGQLSTQPFAVAERLAEGQNRLSEGQNRLAVGQERLIDVLAAAQSTPPVDEESRMRLRSIDVQLLKIYDDLGTTRDAEILLLRRDIGDLTQALRDLVAAARTPARPSRTHPGE